MDFSVLGDRQSSPGLRSPDLRHRLSPISMLPPIRLPLHNGDGDARARCEQLMTSDDSDDEDFVQDMRQRSQQRPSILSHCIRVFSPFSRHTGHRRPGRSKQQRCRPVPCLLLFIAAIAFISVTHRLFSAEKQWAGVTFFLSFTSSLVFRRADLRRILEWEVANGHFPSRHHIPEAFEITRPPRNPALPPQSPNDTKIWHPHDGSGQVFTEGVGPSRVYPDVQSKTRTGYPPRPQHGSVADLDIVVESCSYDNKKYVRDCLEFLRDGAGLNNGKRLNRGPVRKYTYLEQGNNATEPSSPKEHPVLDGLDSDAVLAKKRGAGWERLPVLPPIRGHHTAASLSTPCDPAYPRIFHVYWTGAFTDKPYALLLSFLYTQNLELHQRTKSGKVCRPQFWVWINPGPASAGLDPDAEDKMMAQLRSSGWASPFLHPRFDGIIRFKLWNTTEQLDGVPELRDEWRSHNLFNSLGKDYTTPAPSGDSNASGSSEKDGLTGSKSADSYDRLSVILSDIARFVLCHRFGGIYVDADTLFLRDWEELWGWHGAFAYRWSRMERYNTAVLHLNKGSTLGTFLLRTALRNNFDFHPGAIYRYVKDAQLDGLLLRLPVALFDPAWLGVEGYQRDRPALPAFHSFSDFFQTPAAQAAAPQVVGIEGFFSGAYSYHYHNSWWTAFDASRNYPDLGERFIEGERTVRAAAEHKLGSGQAGHDDEDARDLGWSTAFKRTFEGYIRGDSPNRYGEWIEW
ncbi:hypothetical protein HGRIS_006073 [Hohenbuehelia grisea]|uniref:Glycosyltransferase family 32 protein n=1 Tax=Hohenbuehelia grisea TaxID=104357 RepID=A0ABR3K1D2_9AGAR